MHGFSRCLSLRLGLLSLLVTMALTGTVSPILAEPTRGGTLKFVTANDLKVLDPFWTTAYISRNHGYMIYDVLFALDDNLTVQPQMIDTWEVSRIAYVIPSPYETACAGTMASQ